MNYYNNYLTTLCIFASTFSILLMPLNAQANEVNLKPKVAERIIVSPSGEKFEIPATITRVAPTISSVVTLTAMLDSEKIVASISTISPFFKQVFTKYNFANPKNLDVRNVEEMIEARPQVIYGPTVSDAILSQYAAAGMVFIPINVFDNIEDIQKNATFVASILGGKANEKAEKYNKYFNNNMAYVEEIGATIPAQKREKVMYVRYKGQILESSGNKDIASVYIGLIGALNAMQKFESSIGIGPEDIIGSKADVIFINNNDGKNELINNPALQTVPAIRDKRVYVVPTGVYLWSLRTEESALFPLWLASNVYPEFFPEINMEEEVLKFYKTFYKYTLSDEDVKKILAGT